MTAASAYRAGACIRDDRNEEIHDYRNRKDIQFSAFDPRFESRQSLWNQAEKAEKAKNATVGREFLIALPNEWEPQRMAEFSLEFVDQLVERHGFAWQMDIHEGDGENPHAHIIVSTRRWDEDVQEFGEKTRELDSRQGGGKIIKQWRAEYESMIDDWHQPELAPSPDCKLGHSLCL